MICGSNGEQDICLGEMPKAADSMHLPQPINRSLQGTQLLSVDQWPQSLRLPKAVRSSHLRFNQSFQKYLQAEWPLLTNWATTALFLASGEILLDDLAHPVRFGECCFGSCP
jgi:hypothetical protein